MQLPPTLRAALADRLDAESFDDLRLAGSRLSQRYRAETRDGRQHLDGEAAVLAYLAARMPATFAAIRASLAAVAGRRPDFAPVSLLDVGAGPGTALFAARDAYPGLARATLVEASAPAMAVGEALTRDGFADGADADANNALHVDWVRGDLATALAARTPADLVTLGYVLDELAPAQLAPLMAALWRLTAGVLLVVEPGTPAGWQRILAARDALLEAGRIWWRRVRMRRPVRCRRRTGAISPSGWSARAPTGWPRAPRCPSRTRNTPIWRWPARRPRRPRPGCWRRPARAAAR